MTAPFGVPVGTPRCHIADEPEPEPETRAIWTNAIDRVTPDVAGDYGRATHPGDKTSVGYKETLWRWRVAIQNDFAARMEWAVKPPR